MLPEMLSVQEIHCLVLVIVSVKHLPMLSQNDFYCRTRSKIRPCKAKILDPVLILERADQVEKSISLGEVKTANSTLKPQKCAVRN